MPRRTLQWTHKAIRADYRQRVELASREIRFCGHDVIQATRGKLVVIQWYVLTIEGPASALY